MANSKRRLNVRKLACLVWKSNSTYANVVGIRGGKIEGDILVGKVSGCDLEVNLSAHKWRWKFVKTEKFSPWFNLGEIRASVEADVSSNNLPRDLVCIFDRSQLKHLNEIVFQASHSLQTGRHFPVE